MIGTHWAVVTVSGRLIRVTRRGRLLFYHSTLRARRSPLDLHWPPVSTCVYDHRFHLLPRGWCRRGHTRQEKRDDDLRE